MSTAADNERLILLCERLVEATPAGAARWRAEGDEAYVWERDEGSVAVASRDHDGRLGYEVVVLNPHGERVDELVSDPGDATAAAATLAELHRVARRSALHADEIVEALIDALPSPSREASPWSG